jgi:hypothetical protein
MRFSNAGTRPFRKGLGAGLLALLGLLFLASPAVALTWGEINQQIKRSVDLTNEAMTLAGAVRSANIRDAKSLKKAVATLKKAENKLEREIDIYQTLAQADLPPATILPSSLTEIKSSISRNLAMAKQSLRQTQSLRRRVEKEGLGLVGSGVQMELVINLHDLRYQNSLLQQRLQAHNLR